jgi:hypothetical protein
MPIRELSAYAAQLVPLEAHESLLAAERLAVGTGAMQERDRRAVVSRWQRALGPARRIAKPDAATLPSLTRAAGIAFRTVRP